jgi:thiol:disulfide interchange protein DsbA
MAAMSKRLVLLFFAAIAISACTGDKSATAAAPAAAAAQNTASTTANAAPAHNWQLGSDYFLIDPRVPTSTGNKVEVVEVFSYACPHCAHFEPTMKELESKLPADAQVVLIPAVFNQSWEPFARAYYTAKALGVAEKSHDALFDALHTQHLPLYSIDSLANGFYSKFGADPQAFLSTANSFIVDNQIANGNRLVAAYGVSSTPTLVINGKYRVEMNSEKKIGPDEVVEIALMLVKQEEAAAKK